MKQSLGQLIKRVLKSGKEINQLDTFYLQSIKSRRRMWFSRNHDLLSTKSKILKEM